MSKSHQDSIAEIIYHLLKMPNNLTEALARGNPFDKLLRSYGEFTFNGHPLYRNKRSIDYYPFSINAYKHFRKYDTLDGLHAEHIVPLSIVKDVLLNNASYSLKKVKFYLAENNKIVVITKEEQKLIDSTHRSTIPDDGVSRLDFHKIKIASSTNKNTLNSKK